MRTKCCVTRFEAWAALVLVLVILSGAAAAQSRTFAVIADSRSEHSRLRNVLEELRDMKNGATADIPGIGIVIALGDIDPVSQTRTLYREIFQADAPPLLPVRGNHEKPADVRVILEDMLPALTPSVKLHVPGTVNYVFDWNDARFIVLDQYSEFARNPNGSAVLEWLENAIVTAPEIRHVFICRHEPYMPDDPPNDPLWRVLLRHNEKVRAFFVGHTHVYNRRRIPDEPGGIPYVNVGNAGQRSHNDLKQTIVAVTLGEDRVSFRAVQTPSGTKAFRTTDRFQVTIPRRSEYGRQPPAEQPREHSAID